MAGDMWLQWHCDSDGCSNYVYTFGLYRRQQTNPDDWSQDVRTQTMQCCLLSYSTGEDIFWVGDSNELITQIGILQDCDNNLPNSG